MRLQIQLAPLWLALGCAAGSTGGGGSATTGSRHTTTSTASRPRPGSSTQARTSSAATSGGSSASSTFGGSSGGGASSAGSCLSAVTYPDGGGCPNGSLVSEVVDFLDCLQIGGATVQALDANGVPTTMAVTTAQDGTFGLCAPAGNAFTPSFSVPGYPMMYDGELLAGQSSYLRYTKVISTDGLAAMAAIFPGGQLGAGGLIIAQVYKNSLCPDPSGWSMTLTDTDGGALPDGGYSVIYLGATTLPDPTLTATSATGYAIVYNIDLTTSSYFSLIPSNPDAGCSPSGMGIFYSGRVFVSQNAATYLVFEMQ